MKIKIIIALGHIHSNIALKTAQENNGRIKNWLSPVPSLKGRIGAIVIHNCGKYSSRCPYTKYKYTPTIQSWGVVIDNGNRIAGRVGKQGFCLTAPRGYNFTTDVLGAKLQTKYGKHDYHFDSEEIFDGIKGIVSKLRTNIAKQKEARRSAELAKRSAKIYEREIGTTRVTLDDSRRAGNCIEGSLVYAEQKLHLTRDEILHGSYLFSVPAALLLKTNGHDGVKRAVNAAWMRETNISI